MKTLTGLCLIIALGGCMDRDPYRRTDVWRPTGANAANIAAQVAEPKDLIRGHGSPRANSSAQIIAVDRVQTDRHKPLPASTVSPGTSGGGSGAGAGS